MSQLCADNSCKRAYFALCSCCQQNICMTHLTEHKDLLNSQVYPLADDINILDERLRIVDIRNIIGDCHRKLEQLRLDCHQRVDQFIEQKYQAFDRLVAEKIDTQREKISDIRSKVAERIHEQEVTSEDIDIMLLTIRHLEKEMNRIELAYFQIHTQPLLIDDSVVQFKEIYKHEFDLSILSTTYRTIVYPPDSWRPLASNERLLLIHQAPNLCILDAELTIVKQVLWSYELIRDMCWSPALDRLLAVADDTIFLVDQNTMSIERMQITEKQQWFSCTCFHDQLFLSTGVWGSSIVQIRLLPSITVIKEWKSPTTCVTNEFIDDIVCSNETLALIIRNKVENSMRMELRCCMTLHRLWSLSLDVVYAAGLACRCCSLDTNGWLVTDFNTERLLHITIDGEMKQTITYKAISYRSTLLGSNMLVIATEKGINFHKI